MEDTRKQNKKGSGKKSGKLRIKELEKKVLPSPLASKKPPVPPPYAPGTYYALAKRENLK